MIPVVNSPAAVVGARRSAEEVAMRSAEIKEALCFVTGTGALVVVGVLLGFLGGAFVAKVNTIFLAMAR